ncbi:alpha/beta hydrolase [Luethyella okanaganae]|uniref:Alpha/beta hydrolase n=1 Tax=Luethyella okanaganae TaxID=69372 RepID=A0ABW1VC19_9MICO
MAAVLSASLALGGVSEAFVAHEPTSLTVVADIGVNSDNLPPWLNTASLFSVSIDPAALQRATGISLLSGLSRLSRSDIVNYVTGNPQQISALLDARLAPSDVSAWWQRMTALARSDMIAGAPSLVGNLEGVPYRMRDKANLLTLDAAVRQLQDHLDAGVGKGVRQQVTRQLAMLEQVREALIPKKGEASRTLVALDITGQGRAVIADGDLDRANYISYLIPGMYFSVDQQIVDWADTASVLHDQQQDWLRRLPDADDPGATPTVATIAWIGYQTPDLLNVGGLDLAQGGADALERSWAGIRASRGSDQPFLAVLAHSYGSTAALIALERHTVEIDALALVGSPGSTAQSVAALDVANGNVFVGEADWDPVVNTAFYGSDPGTSSYGATRMGVAGGTDPLDHDHLAPSFGHNDYFKPGSESLRNMALIGIDRGAYVTSGTRIADGTTLALSR